MSKVMSNEDAICILLRSNEYHHARGDLPHSAASIEAFDKAIEALRTERPKGEWKKLYGQKIYCSNCKKDREQNHINFCGFCGADMR